MIVKLSDLTAKYRHVVAAEVDDKYELSEHGYWILPNGDLIALDYAMTHGEVAGQVNNEIYNDVIKECSDETKKQIGTKMDVEAVSTYKWFRINMSPYNDDINCSWSTVSPQQLDTLRIVQDMHDPDKEGYYWWTTGSGSYNDMQKAIMQSMQEKG